jgi:hypothetical protein
MRSVITLEKRARVSQRASQLPLSEVTIEEKRRVREVRVRAD